MTRREHGGLGHNNFLSKKLSIIKRLHFFQSCRDSPALPHAHAHDIATNHPRLGVSSSTPRPLLDLVGVKDQELQEKMARDAFKSLKQVRS